jgi:23S rRNA pseudouridine1911/1915/1917 synthase
LGVGMSDAPVIVKPNATVKVRVVHEDGELLVVEKDAGVVTQPGKGHANDSLLNGIYALREGLMAKLLTNLGVRRDFGLLHRLDKETSGLLVVAKTPGSYDQLRRDFEARQVDKEYLTLVAGIPKPRQGVVQARLKEVQVPNPASGYGTIKKVVVSRQGQEAISAYRVMATAETNQKGTGIEAALVHVDIKTGRLHQIRAHMLFLNCQVLGDNLYAAPETALDIRKYPRAPRLCLHASRLGFKHPATGKWVHFASALPAELARYAAKLGLPVPDAASAKPE